MNAMTIHFKLLPDEDVWDVLHLWEIYATFSLNAILKFH